MFDLNQQRQFYWQALQTQLHQITQQGKNLPDSDWVAEHLTPLLSIERLWAFPGLAVVKRLQAHIQAQYWVLAETLVNNVVMSLARPKTKVFAPFVQYEDGLEKLGYTQNELGAQKTGQKPCFDVLVFHPNPTDYQWLYVNTLLGLQTDKDEYFYDLIFVTNLADALAAILSNVHIQACVSLSGCGVFSDWADANALLAKLHPQFSHEDANQDKALVLQQLAAIYRPEISQFYISQWAFADLPVQYFNVFSRVLYFESPFKDLHHHLLSSVRERAQTPFYQELHAYSQKPKGVFHALPISRGSSIKQSVWVKDFYAFYGATIFDAETSSTQGGLDSLLNPKGAIKGAQIKAEEAFNADHTFFVTNGTSTSNKIVMQANIRPGDLVLIASDCHKSVPYGAVLAGAEVCFLQTNSVEDHELYGAIDLAQIRNKMLALQSIGQLHRLKQIVLTNATFDGLVYDVEAVMMSLLALKPDLIFHWDEAWFAHARFNPIYRQRHAMTVAKSLQQKLRSAEYQATYLAATDKTHLPNPEKVVLRVYATQSSHKTLSCFRQGSMIHILDEKYNQACFLDAYYTHTSTSPNYQILASLDMARSQMALEGYALTLKSLQLSYWLVQAIQNHPKVGAVFQVLNVGDIFPESPTLAEGETQQPPDLNATQTLQTYAELLANAQQPGMRLDPTRITLNVAKTGLSGHHFRKMLIDYYDIQINKTSKYTVLFIVTIGATQQSVQHLFNVLLDVAEKTLNKPPKLQLALAPKMPLNRRYHPCFEPQASQALPHLNLVHLRHAYYEAYDDDNIDYIKLNSELIAQAQQGATWVSASFVTPYPPGFPLLVPGQLIDVEVLLYFASISNEEIHGYQKELGLKVFRQTYLEKAHEC